jgi:hypothetical protein
MMTDPISGNENKIILFIMESLKKRPHFTGKTLRLVLTFFIVMAANAALHAGEPLPMHQQERIHLHTDRDIFVAGEHVFYQLNVYNPSSRQRSNSNIAYLVLRDLNNQNTLEQAIRLDRNQAFGAFYLPDTMSTGHYELVAFTNFMRNQGEWSFFRKQLFVANRFDGELNIIERFNVTNRSRDLKFHPEGGMLMAGKPTRVAVDAGEPGRFAGQAAYIVSQHQDTLSSFQFDPSGFAVFTLTPEAETAYVMALENGQNFSLPRAEPEGISMAVTQQDGEISLTIFPQLNRQATYSLLTRDHAGLQNRQRISLHDQPVVQVIPTTELAEGVVHFSIQDQTGRTFTERIWYNATMQRPALEIKGVQHRAGIREKVPFSIQSGLNPNERMQVSVAIVRQELLFDSRRSMLELLQAPDATLPFLNYVASRIQTFNDQVSLNDLLLLARFKPGAVTRQESFSKVPFLREQHGFNLLGRLVSSDENLALGDQMIYLSTPDTLLNFNYAKTLADGTFHFHLDNYYHNRELYLTVADRLLAGKTNIRVFDRFELQTPFTPYVRANANDYIGAITELQRIVTVQKHYGIRGEMVTYSTEMPGLIPQPLYHNPVHVIYPAEYVPLDDFVEIARELIFPLRLRQQADGRYNIRLVNDRTSHFLDGEPILFLDAIPVRNVGDVVPLASRDIHYVEVLNIPWIFGDVSFDGVVSIVSHGGRYQDLTPEPSAAVLRAPSLASRIDFRAQEYQGPENGAHTPDFRTLLGWYPQLSLTTGSGTQNLSFVSGDLKGNYVIIVNGVAANGKPVGTFLNFEIR